MPAAPIAHQIPKLRARELYFFALFRCLQAAILALWVFGPFSSLSVNNPSSALNALSITCLVAAAVFLLGANLSDTAKERNLQLSLGFDVLVFAGLAYLLPHAFYSVALIMLVNLAAGGLLLRSRQSLVITVAAVTVLLGHYLYAKLSGHAPANIAQTLMVASSYAATVVFCQMLAMQAQQSQALADTRGLQLADMSQMNELIIKRMRTGVIVLDAQHTIVLSNDAANQLNQRRFEPGQRLQNIAPELDKRLWQWRRKPDAKAVTLNLYAYGPEVIPRFVALTLHEVQYLIFLDDSRVFSGRAEELQLASLGRLSASIAHEIRNPLAAISYAQQLLMESEHLHDSDQRMLAIIATQSQRMNAIIENILQLAKREAAQPQRISLNTFVLDFVEEYLVTHPQERDCIQARIEPQTAYVFFDTLHLHQIVTILLQNALSYGRHPGQAANVRLHVRTEAQHAYLEVIDSGPGIAPVHMQHLFTPFFSTHEHGTGLGLYIAKQLADANQSQLRYVAIAGGSNFCLRIACGQSLMTAP